MWNRKKNLRRDSMALTRSFGVSSFRKQSFHARGHNTVAVRGAPHDNNHADHKRGPGNDLRLTRTCSADSSSDNKSDDWLIKIKRRAQVIFGRKKSSESREGVIDTRFDCDGVPEIDAEDTFICNGRAGDRMLGNNSPVRRGSSDGSGEVTGASKHVSKG